MYFDAEFDRVSKWSAFVSVFRTENGGIVSIPARQLKMWWLWDVLWKNRSQNAHKPPLNDLTVCWWPLRPIELLNYTMCFTWILQNKNGIKHLYWTRPSCPALILTRGVCVELKIDYFVKSFFTMIFVSLELTVAMKRWIELWIRILQLN